MSLPIHTPPVTPLLGRLLREMSSGHAMSSAEIRTALGLKDRTHVRQTYIDPALTAGLIEYTIPDHPNSRLQKYRLTDQGRAVLAAMSGGQP